MDREIRFRDEARQELREAVRWYEDVQTGLGSELIRTLEAVLGVVARHPKRYPVVHGSIRKSLMRRFPYAIFYSEVENHIQVVAVFHGRRNPSDLQARLSLLG